eukprot:2718582-Rhodomonas_salina.2
MPAAPASTLRLTRTLWASSSNRLPVVVVPSLVPSTTYCHTVTAKEFCGRPSQLRRRWWVISQEIGSEILVLVLVLVVVVSVDMGHFRGLAGLEEWRGVGLVPDFESVLRSSYELHGPVLFLPENFQNITCRTNSSPMAKWYKFVCARVQ